MSWLLDIPWVSLVITLNGLHHIQLIDLASNTLNHFDTFLNNSIFQLEWHNTIHAISHFTFIKFSFFANNYCISFFEVSGAALASLFSMHMVHEELISSNRIKQITFGEPRSMDKINADYFDELVSKRRNIVEWANVLLAIAQSRGLHTFYLRYFLIMPAPG